VNQGCNVHIVTCDTVDWKKHLCLPLLAPLDDEPNPGLPFIPKTSIARSTYLLLQPYSVLYVLSPNSPVRHGSRGYATARSNGTTPLLSS
jgi:hypothetical protein